MPSVMGVQRNATLRNQRAEIVSAYLYDRSSNALRAGHVHTQKELKTAIAHDIWDNKFDVIVPSGAYEIWAQTTCYKGHASPRPEANKTYEVRETMTEALSLLASRDPSVAKLTRMVHLTFGSPTYAYPWIRVMKDLTFDLSLYLEIANRDIHDDIAAAFADLRVESLIYRELDREIASKTPLGRTLGEARDALTAWYEADMPTSRFGEAQARAVRENMRNGTSTFNSTGPSGSVKQLVVDAMFTDGAGKDTILQKVVTEFLDGKPFLSAARDYLNNWDRFQNDLREHRRDEKLENLIRRGWAASDEGFRSCFRRILLRIDHPSDVEYVQDLDVAGITEHNLYGTRHTSAQVAGITALISSRLDGGSVHNADDLEREILAKGQAILASLVAFEVNNGTRSGYSSPYVLKSLEDLGFGVCRAADIGIELTGYHSQMVAKSSPIPLRVSKYTNLNAVLNNSGSLLCVLKTKHFSHSEFDRRAKEEAFVGLTLTRTLDGERLLSHRKVPFVMCVDTSDDIAGIRAQRALRKLEAFGWTVTVGLVDLMRTLERLDAAD